MAGVKDKIHIGCSGWDYPHWKDVFYASGDNEGSNFRQYSEQFRTVEINNTFYNLPENRTFENWRQQAPPGFIYAVKANRYITHMKKLLSPEEPVKRMLDRFEKLGVHLGPILFQLPPRWRSNPERLEDFCRILPERHEYVFEFRDPSWYVPEIYSVLSKENMTMCLHDMAGSGSPLVETGRFLYIRLHGPGGEYDEGYKNADIARWASYIKDQIGKKSSIYVYFNNDLGANAPNDAKTLVKEINKRI